MRPLQNLYNYVAGTLEAIGKIFVWSIYLAGKGLTPPYYPRMVMHHFLTVSIEQSPDGIRKAVSSSITYNFFILGTTLVICLTTLMTFYWSLPGVIRPTVSAYPIKRMLGL